MLNKFKGLGAMCDLNTDGPCEIEICADNRVTVRMTSDGVRHTWTLRMEDALITEHRFQAAKAKAAERPPCEVIEGRFPTAPRHAADSA